MYIPLFDLNFGPFVFGDPGLNNNYQSNRTDGNSAGKRDIMAEGVEDPEMSWFPSKQRIKINGGIQLGSLTQATASL